jgi:hypothetical protein
MLWVRCIVFALLVVFVATYIAAKALPLQRFQSASSNSTLDTSLSMFIKTSTFYLWYHQLQFAAGAATNTVWQLPAA